MWALGGLWVGFESFLSVLYAIFLLILLAVGIWWASCEVCIYLSILVNGGLGILVPCWWWLMWAFGGLLPVHVLGGHLVSFC